MLRRLQQTERPGAHLKPLEIRQLTPEEYALFRNAMEDFKNEVGHEIRLSRTLLGSAMATTVGLSAGYVVWMLKGGSLLASLLSSMPAWQLADPLAVLAGKKGEDSDDDESLETIIDEGAGPEADKEDDNISNGREIHDDTGNRFRRSEQKR